MKICIFDRDNNKTVIQADDFRAIMFHEDDDSFIYGISTPAFKDVVKEMGDKAAKELMAWQNSIAPRRQSANELHLQSQDS